MPSVRVRRSSQTGALRAGDPARRRMRYLVLADVHGDLAALDAAIAHAGPVDGVWFLGDAVDFGPEPDGTVARLRAIGAPWVVGNHDADAAAGRPGDGWSGGQLGAAERAFLGGLPAQLVLGGATLRHSLASDLSLRAPEPVDFDAFDTAVSLVGHTHVPFLYLDGPDGELRWVEPPAGQTVEVPPGHRAIANPGSIGSSFVDPDRSSYLIYEPAARSARLTWHAVPRPALAVVERMRARGAVALAEMQLVYAQGRLPEMLRTAADHRGWATRGPQPQPARGRKS
jgi:predicted phosphodiesterase